MGAPTSETNRVSRVQGAGLTLAYREWNAVAEGEPLVLLHGITGSGANWGATASHLQSRRLIALDARGHDESDWDPGEAYGGDQHFADVATALDELEVEHCVLVGFSMGGSVAILTAACIPDRIAAVVVIDAYPPPRMTTGSRRIAGWVSTAHDENRSFDPAIARHLREMMAAGDDERSDLRPMWEAIECPSLVVRGAQSDVLPRDVADDMLRLQPRSRLVTIPAVAHAIPLYKPRELAVALADFADSIEGRGDAGTQSNNGRSLVSPFRAGG